MSGKEAAISIAGLDKRFGHVKALNGLNLHVSAGEVHGFLGPNGAGKSTTIRIILGLMKSDGGSVRVLGRNVWSERADLHRDLAYVPGDVTLWSSLTGGECIDLLLRMRGHRRARNAPWRNEMIERLDLDPTKRTRTYSKGNRQKVALVAAFAAPVDLLILDEPTSGLDPLMETVFQGLVSEAAVRGTTVLLSSHILAEVERLCESITIIRSGETVESGTLADLRRLARSRVNATMIRPVDGLSEVSGVQDVIWNGKSVSFSVNSDRMQPALSHLAAGEVLSMTSEQPSLEELFMRHYEPSDRTNGITE